MVQRKKKVMYRKAREAEEMMAVIGTVIGQLMKALGKVKKTHTQESKLLKMRLRKVMKEKKEKAPPKTKTI